MSQTCSVRFLESHVLWFGETSPYGRWKEKHRSTLSDVHAYIYTHIYPWVYILHRLYMYFHAYIYTTERSRQKDTYVQKKSWFFPLCFWFFLFSSVDIIKIWWSNISCFFETRKQHTPCSHMAQGISLSISPRITSREMGNLHPGGQRASVTEI